MSKASQNHVVVGGGISGLLAALLIAESEKGGAVHLIERESEIGGLLRCFDYGEFGKFDYGMHNMYQTGILDLDALLLGLLPEREWQYLKDKKRDLAGLFFRNRLQHNSSYMDLRSLPKDLFAACVAGFFTNLDVSEGSSAENAYQHSQRRFGQAITDEAVAPVIGKLFRQSATDMDVMATQLTSIDRVIMFDEPQMLDLMQSNLLGRRLAYPEQRNLPAARASGRMAYYPRDYGMYRVIDAMRRRLTAAGVRIITGANITNIRTEGSQVSSIQFSQGTRIDSVENIGALHWTAGLPALAALMNISMQGIAFDKPLKTVAVNLLLSRDPNMGDLYYFYCYDKGFDTFRVTNFSAYCDNARRAGGTPLCVELLIEGGGKDGASDPAQQALRELEQFGVLADNTKVLFAKAEPLAYGFPLPTIRNVAAQDLIRNQIANSGLRNLLSLGILSEPHLFFQKDVVAHTYKKISEYIGRSA